MKKKIDEEIEEEEEDTEHGDFTDEEDTKDLLENANKVAERIEKANAKHEELLKRQERLAVESALGGQSEAGIKPVKKKDDLDDPVKYAKEVFKGNIDPLEVS